MKAYFAGQCGAVLGSLAGVGVAIALDKMDTNKDELKPGAIATDSDRRAFICIAAGSALGGLLGVVLASK